MAEHPVAGIDIGGTFIKYGVATPQGELLWNDSIPSHADSGVDGMLVRIEGVVREILRRTPGIASIGVGVPGVVDAEQGTVNYPPNLAGWEVVPLRRILQEVSPVPVYLENDANAAALAEAREGAGKGLRDFLYVTLGTGVGGGIIIGDQLYRGPQGDAGEIGHIIVRADADGDERSFRTGVLEAYTGRDGIMALAASRGMIVADVVDIVHAAGRGDAIATGVLTDTGRLLGIGISSALAILGLRNVVLGGGIAQSDMIIDTVTRTIRERAIPTIAASAQVMRARFRADTGVLGACLLS